MAHALTLSVQFHGDCLLILDQQKLPHKTQYISCTKIEEVWECIRSLQVRGAPAIGMAAAYGLAIWAHSFASDDVEQFFHELKEKKDYLASSRPTAVNLFWALDRVTQKAQTAQTVAEAKKLLVTEAKAIQQEDEEVCRKIGEYGLSLLQDGDAILTICNAGGIATARYGTALAPLYLAKEKGWKLSAYACETRPLLQGARLTTWELQQAEIDVTLITDSMAAYTIKNHRIRAVIVGCDRVAANGDTANKIGTFGLALIASQLKIPFYVAAPLSTIDLNTPTGDQIPIEMRAPDEITQLAGHVIAPKNTKVLNPAFDVTPHEYITAFITEHGIIRGNYQEAFKQIKTPPSP